MSGERIDDKGETTSLPTRVIDVGDEPFSIPRLRTSNGEQGAYIALSYCWGTCEVVKTLSMNIESFHQALPLDRLPQTIKDAITVTKRLGFRYLWVDALCIVQDDHDDWAAEAKRMSSVYQYAFLTIAAISGVEATSGLFTPKPPEQTVHVGGLQFSMPLATLDEELDRSKWNTRGWVMQERFLSRQLVHYAHSQLYFECKEGYISEGDQNAYHSEKSKNSGFDTIATNDNHEYQSRFSERSRKLNFRLNSLGTRSEDLIEKDKLAAIEGLSQAVCAYIVDSKRSRHEKNATKHLAGMLIDGLFQQLKWWPSRKANRCATFRAPSWSWASWDGAVYMAKAAESKYKTAIENSEIISSTTPLCDELGAQFGALQLSGYIKSLKVGPRKNLYKKEQCSFDLLAKTTINAITGFPEKKATKPRAGYRIKGGYTFLDETPEDRPESVECLLLFTSSGSEYNEHALNHFMVLEKAGSTNVYLRLGIGVVEDQNGSKLFSSLFKSSWAKERKNVILV
ncbi:HET-domain-containing protein [Pyrenochaeta sp. DS3sAY3a]|nr:HET-domain-containing protein [Pyrenochaeta sp. DS3sAY3a]